MAINFGLANDYNVFVFGDLNLSNTDAEGRVAVGGKPPLATMALAPESRRCPLPTQIHPLWWTGMLMSLEVLTPAATR